MSAASAETTASAASAPATKLGYFERMHHFMMGSRAHVSHTLHHGTLGAKETFGFYAKMAALFTGIRLFS